MTITIHKLIAGICEDARGDTCIGREPRQKIAKLLCDPNAPFYQPIPQPASASDFGQLALQRYGRTCQ